jgi:hypothetical protein
MKERDNSEDVSVELRTSVNGSYGSQIEGALNGLVCIETANGVVLL